MSKSSRQTGDGVPTVQIYGKQTSALFVAVSQEIKFNDNVLYDGAKRAASAFSAGILSPLMTNQCLCWMQGPGQA